VMVENVPTLAVKVDPFLSDRSRDEDFWAVRRIESEEIAASILSITFYKLDGVAVLSPGMVSCQQRIIFLGTNESLQIGVNAMTINTVSSARPRTGHRRRIG